MNWNNTRNKILIFQFDSFFYFRKKISLRVFFCSYKFRFFPEESKIDFFSEIKKEQFAILFCFFREKKSKFEGEKKTNEKNEFFFRFVLRPIFSEGHEGRKIVPTYFCSLHHKGQLNSGIGQWRFLTILIRISTM